MTTAAASPALIPSAALNSIVGRIELAAIEKWWARNTAEPATPVRRGNRRPSDFRKRDVRRAIQAVRAEGLHIVGIEIDGSGKIIVRTGNASQVDEPTKVFDNPWDTVTAAKPARRK